MKNDATFVRMRSGDHLGDAKMSKKGHLAPSNLTFLIIAIDRNSFRRRKEEGPILCTPLYRNPMQASNFGGTFDQLFLRIFL